MSFSDRLKELRRLNNISQKKFADMVGITVYKLRKYESNEIPRSSIMSKMARALNVKIDYFFREPIKLTQVYWN